MSLSIPIQAPCRQLCRSQPRRLKETLPLIGTASSSANEHFNNNNNDEEQLKKSSSLETSHHSRDNATCENDYTPPPNLQQQVQNLEQLLQQENWTMLNERSNCWNNKESSKNLALATSMIADMDMSDDEDDFDSIESIQNLKEELKWAEMELGEMNNNCLQQDPTPSSIISRGGENQDKSCDPTVTEAANDPKENTFCTLSDCDSDVFSTAESLTEDSPPQDDYHFQTITADSSPQTCNEQTTELVDSSPDLPVAKVVQNDESDGSSLIKTIRRAEAEMEPGLFTREMNNNCLEQDPTPSSIISRGGENQDKSCDPTVTAATNDLEENVFWWLSDCESDVSSTTESLTKEFPPQDKHHFQTIAEASSPQTCNEQTTELASSSPDLPVANVQNDESDGSSLIKTIRRAESILVLSGAHVFVAPLLLGDPRKKSRAV